MQKTIKRKVPMNTRMKKIGQGIIQNRWLYVLILPALVYLIIFNYLPMYGIQIAFKDYKAVRGIAGSPWTDLNGFKHFYTFFNAYYFGRLISNTLLLNVLGLIFSFPMPEMEAQVAYLFYGSIQGGWQTSSYVIGTEPTRLHLQKPDNLEVLKRITEKERLPFSPEVIRLVLPYGNCIFLKAEGDLEPPRQGDTPADCYLAYGSSITHGSLASAAPYTYPFRIAQKMKCDYLNLGFAGTAQMEPAMAEYIVSRKDWSFASVEMLSVHQAK